MASPPIILTLESPAPSPVGPLFVWLLLQLLALGLAAARVPFYALKSFPPRGELVAMNLMLVVQIGTAALLFPFLLRSFQATIMVAVAAWPFTLLAGFLTAEVNERTLWSTTLYITLWLLDLGMWRYVLRSPRAQAAGVAIALMLTLGAPIFWYLSAEYGNSPAAIPWARASYWSPLMGVLAITRTNAFFQPAWYFAAGHFGLATLAMLLCWWLRRRRSA